MSVEPRIAMTALVLIGCLCLNAAHADPLHSAIRSIERDLGARLGLYVRDTRDGEVRAYRADQRFPLNSTFKLFACAALLSRVEAGDSELGERVDLRAVPIETYSPAVEAWMGTEGPSASYGDLCAMMLSVSDNTAANLVLAEIGGPEGFTRFMRGLGDDVTRLDRWETDLNEAAPGDPRDTTTPRAIGESLEKILLGEVLTEPSRGTLRHWLAGHRVAGALFRAALPEDWSIDDRSGAGGHGARGIVAVIYPPHRQPLVATMFLRDTPGSLAQRDAAVATVGEAIVRMFSPPRDSGP